MTTTTEQTNEYLLDIIVKACTHCYGKVMPNTKYLLSCVKLMMATVLHESGNMRYRRQLGYRQDTMNGAFGIAQTEKESVKESILFLRNNDEIHTRLDLILPWTDQALLWRLTDRFLFSDYSQLTSDPDVQVLFSLLQTQRGDLLSVILARLHYLRIPAPIPEEDKAIAEYAKKYYNTRLGTATVENYLACIPKLIASKGGKIRFE